MLELLAKLNIEKVLFVELAGNDAVILGPGIIRISLL
jgi:hypothetical protein